MNENAPNIFLITVDSLRADYCGFHDRNEETTPYLTDRLSTSGIVYENAIAPGPSTHESMPAIFSGSTPATRGRGLTKKEQISSHLAAHKAVPERLVERGYSTAAFTPNPFTSQGFSYDGGWDHFEDYLDSGSPVGKIRSTIVKRWLSGEFVAGLRFFLNMIGQGDIAMRWREMLPDILDTISELSEPFFVWVFLLEPHWPYLPTSANRDVSRLTQWNQNWRTSNASELEPTDLDALRSLYRGTIRDVDEFIERLTTEFSDYDPTYVLHGDHGEAFGEHGNFGHKPVLYEENIHVPWVIWNDNLSPKRISGPVSLRKLPRFLGDLADRSLSAESYVDTIVYSSSDMNHVVARAGDWKLYSRPNDGVLRFDLTADPDERSPKPVSEVPDRVRRRQLIHQDELERITGAVNETKLQHQEERPDS